MGTQPLLPCITRNYIFKIFRFVYIGLNVMFDFDANRKYSFSYRIVYIAFDENNDIYM